MITMFLTHSKVVIMWPTYIHNFKTDKFMVELNEKIMQLYQCAIQSSAYQVRLETSHSLRGKLVFLSPMELRDTP